MRLDRKSIVAAAFAVLEEKGFEGLGLRPVAAKLGVKAPALYWYVKSKGHLLALMAEQIYANARADKTQRWQCQLVQFGHSLRRELLGRRDAVRLCAMAEPLETPDESADRLLSPFVATGLTREAALSRQAVVIAYTLGWVLYEQSQPMHRHLERLIDFDLDFERGLRAIVVGFGAADAGAAAVASDPPA